MIISKTNSTYWIVNENSPFIQCTPNLEEGVSNLYKLTHNLANTKLKEYAYHAEDHEYRIQNNQLITVIDGVAQYTDELIGVVPDGTSYEELIANYPEFFI